MKMDMFSSQLVSYISSDFTRCPPLSVDKVNHLDIKCIVVECVGTRRAMHGPSRERPLPDRSARRPARIDPLPPTTQASSSRKSQPYPLKLMAKVLSQNPQKETPYEYRI